MPRTETVLRVFVASPGDVSVERQALDEVIIDVNQLIGSMHAVRLEVIRWETHTSPSIGKEAQDVINRQINDDYDIFVGIMWSKFGTRTSKYESGTEEEFYRAKDRYNKNPDEVDIMFYFKDEPISPSLIDPDQLAKIYKFKNKIGGEGVYYWVFKDVNEFSRKFRLHISEKVKSFSAKTSREFTEKSDTLPAVVSEADERGMMELISELTDEAPKFLKLMEEIGDHTNWIGERINFHASGMIKLNSQVFGGSVSDGINDIVNESAIDLEKYANYIDSIMPLFGSYNNFLFKTVIEIGAIYKESFDNNSGEAIAFFDSVKMLEKNVVVAQSGLENFLEEINKIPRMNSKISKAKKHISASVENLISEIRQTSSLLQSAYN